MSKFDSLNNTFLRRIFNKRNYGIKYFLFFRVLDTLKINEIPKIWLFNTQMVGNRISKNLCYVQIFDILITFRVIGSKK